MYNIEVIQFRARVLFGVATVIIVAIFATFALSHFEARQRLITVEHQQLSHVKDILAFMQREHLARNLQLDMLRRIERSQSHLRAGERNKFDLVEKEIQKIQATVEFEKYMDSSGRPDYALESAGGRILSIGSTQLVSTIGSKLQSVLASIVGYSTSLPIVANSPRHMIQPSILPGECFAFIGRGEITIKLVKSIVVDAISVEHILAEMSPTVDISNAPNHFSVYGLKNDADEPPTHLGNFHYDIAKHQPLQVYPITNRHVFSAVQFRFLSNHGHPNNTCVYRVRVHGTLNKRN